jgi:energy-coupling factor transporter transmembrane protein EcfT
VTTDEIGPALGVPGRVACLAAVVLAAVGARGAAAGWALGLAIALAVACHRPALAVLHAPYVWAMLALLLVPAVVLGGEPSYAWGPIRVSLPGLALGAGMSARAIAILLAAAGFAATVSVVAVAGLLDRFGLPGLGFSLGVAVNMLPVLQDTATTTWQAFRQRGGFRRRRFRSLRLILATMISETLRKAEDVVAAAHARGFGASRPAVPVRPGRYDLALAAALGAIVIGIWWR